MEDMLRLWIALAGFGVYISLRIIYRLYFHPLSHIPGPKLTACTHLYEFYYNVIHVGPIVRINLREVYISNPNFYNEIYASSSRKKDEDVKYIPTYALPSSMVAAVGHEQHRFRRGIPSFLDVLSRSYPTLWTTLSSDIITAYCRGKDWDFIEDENFRNDVRNAAENAIQFTHISRFIPWLVYAMSALSPRTMAMVMLEKTKLLEFLDAFLDDIELTAYRLGAFISGSLRLAYGITARLSRVAPTESLQYKEYTIPPDDQQADRSCTTGATGKPVGDNQNRNSLLDLQNFQFTFDRSNRIEPDVGWGASGFVAASYWLQLFSTSCWITHTNLAAPITHTEQDVGRPVVCYLLDAKLAVALVPAAYAYPNDIPERERLAFQGPIIKKLFGDGLYFAPLSQAKPPQLILDLVTGVGDWAIEMGDLFPSFDVIVTDLSPIKTDMMPPSVNFYVEDS
ncbi:benzoate 4-monooxygenase cytochrome p450 [Trichoderma arundinaceum]|uniref:Benzoate 4-monooxygenase cytochrome p450 n=1 Tax=Trichoderma arundinaceum TaxID=490622 RepID=A0A395N9I6_TRIAR|nr:benzoate 4-monooxygenase cytochrome p450 [Trichoderma arundinaceum]